MFRDFRENNQIKSFQRERGCFLTLGRSQVSFSSSSHPLRLQVPLSLSLSPVELFPPPFFEIIILLVNERRGCVTVPLFFYSNTFVASFFLAIVNFLLLFHLPFGRVSRLTPRAIFQPKKNKKHGKIKERQTDRLRERESVWYKCTHATKYIQHTHTHKPKHIGDETEARQRQAEVFFKESELKAKEKSRSQIFFVLKFYLASVFI